MSIPITKERWLEAQISERPHHYDEFHESAKLLRPTYMLQHICWIYWIDKWI